MAFDIIFPLLARVWLLSTICLCISFLFPWNQFSHLIIVHDNPTVTDTGVYILYYMYHINIVYYMQNTLPATSARITPVPGLSNRTIQDPCEKLTGYGGTITLPHLQYPSLFLCHTTTYSLHGTQEFSYWHKLCMVNIARPANGRSWKKKHTLK